MLDPSQKLDFKGIVPLRIGMQQGIPKCKT